MRELNMDATTTRYHRSLELNEMDEFRNEAYENAKIYKERTKACHDKNLVRKELQPGQQLRWPRPFTVVKVFPYGAVELQGKDREMFKVNGQRVKPYLGGPIDIVKTIIHYNLCEEEASVRLIDVNDNAIWETSQYIIVNWVVKSSIV
ncbi:uncharacterized protein LOC133791902 [Humulus lupulus]|uniref:uncharacterized protein LOC133791902 n=1 Tax=Humulus lupulus TaxID=3486 RepID=UPI002B409368|nr:uncharacterized protein LOC133791902 [Humulus lupulus]